MCKTTPKQYKLYNVSLRAGGSHEGTALAILEAMRETAHDAEVRRMDSQTYIYWLKGMAKSVEGAYLTNTGTTLEEQAESMLVSMFEAGLAAFHPLSPLS